MPDLTLRICGLAVGVWLDDPRLLETVRRRYAPFLSKGAPDLELRVAVRDGRLRGGPGAGHGAVLGPRGRATIRRGLSPFDSLLRIALSGELVERGGFLCHAAAVDGWLFPGRSGAGKSTLGVAAPQRRLLADELVGVSLKSVKNAPSPTRKNNLDVFEGTPSKTTRTFLRGTPFWGDFRRGRNNGEKPLRGIFFLDRRARRGARPIAPARALARLLQCVLFFGDDARSAGKILALARRVVESAPAFVLSYDARTTGFSGVEKIVRGALR